MVKKNWLLFLSSLATQLVICYNHAQMQARLCIECRFFYIFTYPKLGRASLLIRQKQKKDSWKTRGCTFHKVKSAMKGWDELSVVVGRFPQSVIRCASFVPRSPTAEISDHRQPRRFRIWETCETLYLLMDNGLLTTWICQGYEHITFMDLLIIGRYLFNQPACPF